MFNPFESPSSTRQTFERARRVTCSYEGICVTVAKQELEPLHVLRQQLTFQDVKEEGCVATENATHFVLTTSLTACGTESHIADGATQVHYSNAVRAATTSCLLTRIIVMYLWLGFVSQVMLRVSPTEVVNSFVVDDVTCSYFVGVDPNTNVRKTGQVL